MNPLLISIQDAATGPVLGIFGDLDYTTVGELHDGSPHSPSTRASASSSTWPG